MCVNCLFECLCVKCEEQKANPDESEEESDWCTDEEGDDDGEEEGEEGEDS
jgi:hypothetical protein